MLANAADSDGVRVRIFGARSNGTPYISFYTLTNPVIADGTLTFTAPASATLRKNAGYFVVFDSTASDAGNDYEIRGTESESLNSQADGWSLGANRHAKNQDSASWTTASAVPLIEINADGATVDYLDEDDQLLTDADADTEGFQVDLKVGANTINVRVTAEDGSTTRTYTMVVTREASRVSADALASNLDEHFSKRFYVGNLEPGKILRAQALGFETGDNEAGYVLSSVKILIWEITHSAGVRVRIFSSTAEGNPGSSLYTLSGSVVLPTNPDTPAGEDSPASTFEAPANAILESNTRYFVVLDSRASQMYRFYKVFGTRSDDISKVADGWSMNNFHHTGIRDTGVWTTGDEVPFVDVAGHAIVPSSDATLTDLGLTWDNGGTATDIALDPVFNASTTSYTAAVANGVDRITIAGTKSDSGARVDYFDVTDSALTDADGNAAGFQVNLGVGANTIKAKVAASDGETTQTYTVVVTRAAGVTAEAPDAPAAPTLTAGETWIEASWTAPAAGVTAEAPDAPAAPTLTAGETWSVRADEASWTALRRLDLSGNRVADLRALSGLHRLEVLLLDGNEVSDLSPLWGLEELAHLDLGRNRVVDAALLRESRSLQRLDLAGNRLRDIWVLGDLEKLVWLDVSGNPIADLSPLGRLTGVRWLVLDAGASRTDAARNFGGSFDEDQFGGTAGTSLPVPVWPSR